MNKIISIAFVFASLFASIDTLGQTLTNKRAVSYKDYNNWTDIKDKLISDDGKIICYTFGPVDQKNILVIKSIQNDFEIQIKNASLPLITDDGKNIIYKVGNDSLGLYNIDRQNIAFVVKGYDHQIYQRNGNQFLIYKSDGYLIVKNLNSGEQQIISNVQDYIMNRSNSALVVVKENSMLLLMTDGLDSIHVTSGKIMEVVFDESGTQLAVIKKDKDLNGILTLMCFKLKSQNNVGVTFKFLGKVGNNDLVPQKPYFSKNGQCIYFFVSPKLRNQEEKNLKIWRSDDDLEPTENFEVPLFLASGNLNTGAVHQLIFENEFNASKHTISNENVLLIKSHVEGTERQAFWRDSSKEDWYLSSLDARRKKLDRIKNSISTFQSPGGKFIIFFDEADSNFYTYNISTGIYNNISKHLSNFLIPIPIAKLWTPWPCGIGGWLENDEAVLLYDQFDIWKIDPNGIKKPINLTMGYGRANKTVLRICESSEILHQGKIYLLQAFNQKTKDNGFYSLSLKRNPKLDSLTMGPYVYCLSNANLIQSYLVLPNTGEKPIKAKFAKSYLVLRMSSRKSPNLFYSSDLKDFRQVSFVEPENNYNWLTSELISWKMFDGEVGEGILYKPEDFDKNRKYPVIFYCYEHLSDGLNVFIRPEYSPGWLPISDYVSNGYIVCVPNVYFKDGRPAGESSYNAVVSAAKYLSGFSYVDSTRLGLQGVSFGGYQTMYLVTRSKIFTACAPAAGVSNIISAMGTSDVGYLQAERGQHRLGATLWSDRDKYVKHSPIFNVDKVSTPLLIEVGGKDPRVRPWQGIEFFRALKRLDKPVWLLEYPDADHGLYSENSKDYTLRLKDFFDYYLKGSPPPRWMFRTSSSFSD